MRKIGERRDKRKECNSSISSERLGKQNYEEADIGQASIGLVNEMPNTQNDRSYFKQYFEDFATEEKKQEESFVDGLQTNPNKTNKLERIENELD